MVTSDTVHGCFALLGGFLIMLSLGQMYSVSNMAPYIVSYLHKYVDSSISLAFSVWLSAGSIVSFGIFMPLSGLLWKKIGLMRFVLAGCLLNSAGMFVSSFTIKLNVILLFFTYSIMVGIGVGCAYGLVLLVALSWFPKRHGLVVGICTVGFGGGAIVLLPIQTILINPKNTPSSANSSLFTDIEILDRVPPCLQITAGVITCTQIIGCCIFRQRPNERSGKANQTTVGSSNSTGGPSEQSNVLNATLRQALRTRNFYIFWTIMFLSYFPLNILMAHIKSAAQKPIPDDQFLMSVCAAGAIFNMVGRFFWGYIGDKISFKIPLVLINGVYAAALASLPYVLWIPGAGKACYAIWVPLLFLCLAGNFVMLPFGVARCMGPKYLTTIYGTIFMASAPASLIGAAIFSQIDAQKYLKEIFLANGLVALSTAIISFFLQDVHIPQRVRWLFCKIDGSASYPCRKPHTSINGDGELNQKCQRTD